MNAADGRTLPVGTGTFNPLSGALELEGRTIVLRPRTAALLAYLLHHSDRIVSKDELLSAVWPDAVVTEDSLVQGVKEIRQAFGHGGREWIRTHPRQGYAFVGAAPRRDSRFLPATRRMQFAGAMLALLLSVAALLGWRHAVRPDGAENLSIVVLPVANATGDSRLENTADELTEALTDAVSGMARTSVIGASTSFTFKGTAIDVRRMGAQLKVRYALQGSLRMRDGRRVLALHLADTRSAVQLWHGEFPLGESGLPESGDDVLQGMASSLGLELFRAHALTSGRAASAQAASQLSRARTLLRWSAGSARETQEACDLLEAAVQTDAGIPLAWTLLAYTHLAQARFSPQRDTHLARAAEALRRARELAPENAGLLVVEGKLHYEQGRMPDALRAFERALDTNPSDSQALGMRGAALVMLGRPAEALPAIDQAIRLSPRDFRMKDWLLYEGVAHLHLGQETQAMDLLARAVDVAPENAFARLFFASALGNAGRLEEARAEMTHFQKQYPNFSLSRFKAVEPSDAPAFLAQRQRVYEGLRRAGMPE